MYGTAMATDFDQAANITCVPVAPMPAMHAHLHSPHWLRVRRGMLSSGTMACASSGAG